MQFSFYAPSRYSASNTGWPNKFGTLFVIIFVPFWTNFEPILFRSILKPFKTILKCSDRLILEHFWSLFNSYFLSSGIFAHYPIQNLLEHPLYVSCTIHLSKTGEHLERYHILLPWKMLRKLLKKLLAPVRIMCNLNQIDWKNNPKTLIFTFFTLISFQYVFEFLIASKIIFSQFDATSQLSDFQTPRQ